MVFLEWLGGEMDEQDPPTQ